MSEPTLYLQARAEDVAPLVLLSGDPARVKRGAATLDDGRVLHHSREFALARGVYHGVPVTLASGGIGAPSTAIAIHELAQCGARAIVRVGTMMGVRAHLGNVVLSTGAARFEGTSTRYLPREYPAVPDWELTQALAEAVRAAGLDARLGPTSTHDAFYPEMAPELAGGGVLDLRVARRAGVLGMDMETALLFTLGQVLGVATAAVCLVTVQAQPHTYLDAERRAELDARMIEAVLGGLVAYGAA